MSKSRIAGLYKMSVADRIAELEKLGFLSPDAASQLQNGRQVLSAVAADKMVENVVGVFGLPFAIAPNFIVNDRECIVPLVVEEPSIVAALSNAAALSRDTGGFRATLDESLLAGQVHVVDVSDATEAVALLQNARDDLVSVADRVHPRLKRRGGGVRDIQFRSLRLADGSPLIAIDILVDTSDAMGANLVNSICEAIAPEVAKITGGDVALRILSNLVDRSVCTAKVCFSIDALSTDDMPGGTVRDRIVLASEIASADPYRAATHNKGVMNGIDAVAIATGNDWRAIEAGAHAFAGRGDSYTPLARWTVNAGGDLCGEIEVPLKPGIVGGTLSANSAAALGLAVSGVRSATQLAELMASVGLAQNFAALRALATGGIQKGHMRLHARNVAAAAGASDEQLDDVIDKLIASGEVKHWKAEEIVSTLRGVKAEAIGATATAAGKIILLGEHAVVYGRHALAVPVVDAVRATVTVDAAETTIRISNWGLNCTVRRDKHDILSAVVNLILEKLDVLGSNFSIEVSSSLPRGMGLGSSAAIAVAVTRAVARCVGMKMNDEQVNEVAFACEKLTHGTPSGIDNTLACFAQPMLFQNKGVLDARVLQLKAPPPLVVAFSHQPGPTHEQVAGVRSRFEKQSKNFDALFDQIDDIARQGAEALPNAEYEKLGQLMNICHGLLNAIGVSTPELEDMLAIARQNGALGAKLTGAGGGGSIVALCPDSEDAVRSALQRAGYQTLKSSVTGG